MSKNGPPALIFNALVITFMLAPLVIVCVVASTPANANCRNVAPPSVGTVSMPANHCDVAR